MGAGDIPLVATVDSFLEGLVTGLDMPVANEAVIFPNLNPYSVGAQELTGGWVDVRGLTELTVIVTPVGQGATYTVEQRLTTFDASPTDLVVATGVAAGVQTTLASSADITAVSHFRVLHRYTTTPGGTTTASALAQRI